MHRPSGTASTSSAAAVDYSSDAQLQQQQQSQEQEQADDHILSYTSSPAPPHTLHHTSSDALPHPLHHTSSETLPYTSPISNRAAASYSDASLDNPTLLYLPPPLSSDHAPLPQPLPHPTTTTTSPPPPVEALSLPLTEPISLINTHVIAFAGMRGAVSFSLAYIFPDDNGNRWVLLPYLIVLIGYYYFYIICLLGFIRVCTIMNWVFVY